MVFLKYVYSDTNENKPLFYYEKYNFKYKCYEIKDCYFPIHENLYDKKSKFSAVFTRSPHQIQEFALTQISDSFTVIKDKRVFLAITFTSQKKPNLIVTNCVNHTNSALTVNFRGVISANRAIEIAGSKHGKGDNGIINDILYYNYQQLPVISNKELSDFIISIIDTENQAKGHIAQ